MPRRPLIRASWLPCMALACAAAALLSCSGGADPGGSGSGARADRQRPVILISIDSLRADHTTPYGYRPHFAPDEVTMPFLDRLGREGVVFENASAVSPWTLPSHMSLLSGMHPMEHGVRSRKFSLGPEVDLVSEVFQDAGYHTAGIFSAPFLHPVWGFHRGFDIYTPGPDYLGSVASAEALAASGKGEEVQALHSTSHTDNRTAEPVIDKAIFWLEQEDRYEEPFFLFLHLWDPHYDYFPPEEYRARFLPPEHDQVVGDELMQLERELSDDEILQLKALYDAEIRYTDDQIKRLFDQLEAWGIADDVIVGITSDHGDEFMEHGLRGHHLTLYEEVMHVPMVLHAPGLLPAGTRVSGTVSNLDLAPTLVELAGLPEWTGRSGTSLSPLWNDEDLDREVPMDLLRPARRLELLGYRNGDAKGIYDAIRKRLRVFDLAMDPDELAPRETRLNDPDEPVAVLSLAFFQVLETVRHRVGKVAETAEMTDLLDQLGYTED